MSLTPRLVNRLRLKHWALLSALDDTPRLNQAALRIQATPSSATKLLFDIEQAFGFPLFERDPHGLRQTPLGAEVVAYARQTQASLDRFLEGLELKRQGGHGHLVFGAIMGAAPDLVARAVADIKRERPQLRVRILGETSDQIAALLERNEIELAIGRFSAPLQHNKFDFIALSDEPMRAVVRHGHPLARKRRLQWDDLVAWPWILQTMSSPARLLLEDEFSRAGVASPADVVECTSIFATLQLVQSSDAVSALSESVVRDHVKARRLVTLPLVVGKDLRAFGLLTRRGEPLSEVALAFVAHLQRRAPLHPPQAALRRSTPGARRAAKA